MICLLCCFLLTFRKYVVNFLFFCHCPVSIDGNQQTCSLFLVLPLNDIQIMLFHILPGHKMEQKKNSTTYFTWAASTNLASWRLFHLDRLIRKVQYSIKRNLFIYNTCIWDRRGWDRGKGETKKKSFQLVYELFCH